MPNDGREDITTRSEAGIVALESSIASLRNSLATESDWGFVGALSFAISGFAGRLQTANRSSNSSSSKASSALSAMKVGSLIFCTFHLTGR